MGTRPEARPGTVSQFLYVPVTWYQIRRYDINLIYDPVDPALPWFTPGIYVVHSNFWSIILSYSILGVMSAAG